MKNIDKEPTYYVSLTEYNEVKRMFLKANDEINALKELLKECRFLLGKTPYENTSQYLTFSDVINRVDQVLGEE